MIEDVAFEVLAGERSVLESEEEVRAVGSRPAPVAVHRALGGTLAAVLFLVHRHDGLWQAECVMAEASSEGGWVVLCTAGGMWPDPGAVVEAASGEPIVVLTGRAALDDDRELVAVAGWSKVEGVVALSNGERVASSLVYPHGVFVLSAAVPPDAQIDVRRLEL
jgi:hypothetical protein